MEDELIEVYYETDFIEIIFLVLTCFFYCVILFYCIKFFEFVAKNLLKKERRKKCRNSALRPTRSSF